MEPLPGWLSTLISPPIIWQKRRVMARPRPVPPNLRVVEASAWVKARRAPSICSGVMPTPVSLDGESESTRLPSTADAADASG